MGDSGRGGGGGSDAGGVPGLTPPPPIPSILREQGRSELPQGNRNEVSDPFTAGPRIKAELDTSLGRARAADVMLQQVIDSEIPLNNEDRRILLRERNQIVSAVNQEGMERTQAAIKKMEPLFQQKTAVADRYREVTEMNPLARGFMSLFDASYDREHLRELDAAIGNQLNNQGEQYKAIIDMQSQLVNFVNSNYQGDEMALMLERGFIDEKLKLASMSFAASDLIMNQELAGLQANSGVLAAQNQAKDVVITGMTPAQLQTAHEQAAGSPDGTVTIQGARFTEGELLAAAQKTAEQQVQLDQLMYQRQLAQIQANETTQRMADEAEDRLISNMTTAQIRGALQNGGMYNGQQLTLDKLGAGLQRSMGRDELMVQQDMIQGSTEQFVQMSRGISNTTQLMATRARQLTGVAPELMQQVIANQQPEIASMQQAILRGKTIEERDQIAARYLPTLQRMAKERQDAVTKTAERWAGDNKRLLPLAQSFLSGQPLNSKSAVVGLIELAKTNGSFGSGMSGPAAAAFAAAKRVVQAETGSKPGQSMDQLFGDSPTAVQAREQMEARVTQVVGEIYRGQVFDKIVYNAPAIGKQIGHLGGRLNPEILAEALTAGDSEGKQSIANQLGVRVDELDILFAGGPAAAAIAEKANMNGIPVERWQQMASTASMQSTFRILDTTHPMIEGRKAGHVYVNLLGNERFATTAGQMAAAQAQASMGDMVIGAIGASGLEGDASNYGQAALRAYTTMNQAGIMKRVASANRFGNDAWARTTTILGAIPNLEESEERVLLAELRKAIPPQIRMGLPGAGQAENDQQFQNIRTTLMTTRFQDPRIEAIRRKAAGGFEEYSRITEAALQRLENYSPE